MRRRRGKRSLLVALAGLLAACVPVTVNVNFPQKELDSAAGRIEDMVRSPENPKPAPEPKKGPQGARVGPALAAFFPREAAAQTRTVDVVPEIKVQTPQLMKAIESRRQRFSALRQWKQRGCIGETNQGLVEARPGQDCGPDVSRLIAAENADRDYIYRTLMAQNNIPASDAPRVRAAFAKTHRDHAQPGDWIQLESGQWAKK
jgi:uncharacterized protein YdbL (DUF1318 family)